ncbi:nicotinate-nucleotide adenylyltransferase [Anaerobacillus sp. MEB173]|uniref:nicotinate-nucleotide adenylyltransferase n=1 Tax=Anaerobacillus sp. MEB173 TaxID=3383345 RepID=UPI003F9128A6
MKKVGIIGGTFDPPHFGHLLIAQEVLEQCSLDEVWFMPSHIPPHKQRDDLTSDEERKEMVQRAIHDNEQFRLCDIELKRNGPSYTIDTIKLLKKEHPNIRFYFIIGGDMIDYLPKWVGIKELIEMITFIGVKRPGYPSQSPYKGKVVEVNVPQLDISSSFIRNRVAQRKNIRYMLPEPVRLFLMERGLYAKKQGVRNR